MMTRKRAAASRGCFSTVLSSADIQGLLLPLLDFRSFVALRHTSKEICAATQHVCEDLMSVLERAAALYVSPRFHEGLELIASHQPHICWLLQTPVLAIVAPDRHDELIASSYHLLQARSTLPPRVRPTLSPPLPASPPATPPAPLVTLARGARAPRAPLLRARTPSVWRSLQR